jgi:hypothetical protein
VNTVPVERSRTKGPEQGTGVDQPR